MHTHRIVLRVNRKGKSIVSCECRASETKHSRSKGGGEYYEPIATLGPGETAWDYYNNPDNHWVEFTDKDKVRV